MAKASIPLLVSLTPPTEKVSPSSFSTNGKHIYHPRNYKREVFFEGELGIVIGQPVKDLSSLDDAKNSIGTKLGKLYNSSKVADLNEANQEAFDLQTYKKFLSFLKFQEMIDKYNTY